MSEAAIEQLVAGQALLPRADAEHCRAWIARHSRSFYLSSLLLPAEVRHASWALYAFCRRADDAVDEPPHGPLALDACLDPAGDALAREHALLRRVGGLRARLDRVYGRGAPAAALPLSGADGGGDSLDAIDRSYARVASRYAIPRGVPEALLAGMEMDARGQAYPTWESLLEYCFNVAATVGLMMTHAMGARGDGAPLRAAELGVAMQLTNIARDVGEDARRGRVYLPDDLLASCGIDRQAVLSARQASPALRQATRLLLLRADDFYRSAERGIALLPRRCRPAVASARYIYAAIGDEIAAADHDSVTRRAHTSLGRKLLLVLRGLPWLFSRPRPLSEGPADALLLRRIRATGLEVEA